MKAKKITPFDHTDLFDKEIAPKLKEIYKLCDENNIPFFLEFAVRNTDGETVYTRDMLTPRPMGYTLHTNTILHHAAVSLGYRCMAPEDIQEMEMRPAAPERHNGSESEAEQ